MPYKGGYGTEGARSSWASNTDDAFFNQDINTRSSNTDDAFFNQQRNPYASNTDDAYAISSKRKSYDDFEFDDGDVAGTIGETLHFPIDQSAAYDGRISFEVHKVKEADVDFDNFLKIAFMDNLKEYAGNAINFFTETEEDVDSRDNTTLSLADRKAKEVKDKEEAKAIFRGPDYVFDPSSDRVLMYFPISLQVNDQVSYETPSLGLYGSLAAGAIDRGENVLTAMAGGVAAGLNDVFGALIGRSDISAEAARLVALRAAAKVPNGVGNAIRLGVQRRINPNVRALFQGVTNLRQFAFSFDMMATSQEEAETVEKIIKHFRTEMYPDVLDPNEDGLPIAYKFPNAFSIKFHHRGKAAKIPRLEKCFLTNCDVDYGGAGTGFHPDGRPVKITMTLRFIEMRTLNKRDIRDKGR
jgi:hypothetical protein